MLICCFGLSLPLAAQEICGNGLDDDNDGFIDCFDPDCSGATATINPVSSVADDAEEIEDTGLMELTDLEQDLDFRPNKLVGIRFSNLNIPAGAIITQAYIRFVASPDNQSGATITIEAENNLNPAAFTLANNDISDRTVIAQNATWTTALWTTGQIHDTPSLIPMAQAVVDQVGANTELNSMVFVFTTPSGRSSANSYETADASTRPIFFLEWAMCDSDGDGIADAKDLDDDNDGIPDTQEGYCASDELLDLASLSGSNDPVNDINNANLVLDGANVSMSSVTVGGTAVQNDNELNDVHFTGSHGPKIGILNSNGTADYVRFEFDFNKEVSNLSFKIHDLDDEDQLTINAYRGTTLYTFSISDFTTYGCISYAGSNLFQSSCGNVGANNNSVTLDINLPIPVTSIEFLLSQQPGGDGGGSITAAAFTVACEPSDFDGDGIPNHLDLDSDGDGIVDIIEAGGIDANRDGEVDYPIAGDPESMTDADFDGLSDDPVYDSNNDGNPDLSPDTNTGSTADLGTNLPVYNTDLNGQPDFLDIDADDDGIVDIIEGQSTSGYQVPSNQDLDKDGIDDAFDVDYAPLGYIVPNDQELDGTPDYRDLDSDNDGKSDPLEGYDTDGDGTAEIVALGQDSDGDGLDDAFDKDNNSLTDTFGSDNTDTPTSFPPSNTVANERAWRATGGGSFPVEWLDFQAVWDGKDAKISWATASENGSDYYEIQRSLDGLLFQQLGRVNANGNTSAISQYAYADKAAADLKLTKYFYRLRQVDQNGEFQYSNTIELDLTLREGDISLAAYPNPATDQIEIRYAAFKAGALDLRIFNSVGQLVLEQNLRYDKGNQFQTLDISSWTPGMYVIELASENYASSLKIVKQ